MKKVMLLLVVLMLMSGCALIAKAKGNYELCWADTQPGGCHDKMIKNALMAGEIGKTAGSASGFPVAGTVAGSVFATLGLVLTGVFSGAKLAKKQTTEKPNG